MTLHGVGFGSSLQHSLVNQVRIPMVMAMMWKKWQYMGLAGRDLSTTAFAGAAGTAFSLQPDVVAVRATWPWDAPHSALVAHPHAVACQRQVILDIVVAIEVERASVNDAPTLKGLGADPDGGINGIALLVDALGNRVNRELGEEVGDLQDAVASTLLLRWTRIRANALLHHNFPRVPLFTHRLLGDASDAGARGVGAGSIAAARISLPAPGPSTRKSGVRSGPLSTSAGLLLLLLLLLLL